MSFTLAEVEYEYALPYSINNPEFACVYSQKCHRELLPRAAEKVLKKIEATTKDAKAKSFVAS